MAFLEARRTFIKWYSYFREKGKFKTGSIPLQLAGGSLTWKSFTCSDLLVCVCCRQGQLFDQIIGSLINFARPLLSPRRFLLNTVHFHEPALCHCSSPDTPNNVRYPTGRCTHSACVTIVRTLVYVISYWSGIHCCRWGWQCVVAYRLSCIAESEHEWEVPWAMLDHSRSWQVHYLITIKTKFHYTWLLSLTAMKSFLVPRNSRPVVSHYSLLPPFYITHIFLIQNLFIV